MKKKQDLFPVTIIISEASMNIEYFIKNWKSIKEEDISFSEDEWIDISSYKYLSKEFINNYENKVDWDYISAYQKLSEEFMEKYEFKLRWHYISKYQKLSEPFIEKYKNRVDWYLISRYQNLSEKFIEKYKFKVRWVYISRYQKLSWDFIIKHQDRICECSCFKKYFRLRYAEFIEDLSRVFSVHTNDSYGLCIYWKKKINIENTPSNIIFSKVL